MRTATAFATLAAAAALSVQSMAAEIAPADVAFTDDGIVESLSGAPGDPVEGANVFKNRKLGNCLACHANQDMAGELFHGNVGPSLDGVADRWSVPELRLIIANAKKMFSEETVMPGFYSLEVGKDVRKDLIGATILTAQQIEDVVAYLATLKE